MYRKVVKEYLPKIFSSKDMAEYIRENIDSFEKWRVLNMVCNAPISLQLKQNIFAKMRQYESLSDSQSDELFDPPYTIGNCLAELDKAYTELELKEGELFILHEYNSRNNNKVEATVPLLNYKQLVDYHREHKEYYDENTWHKLEKCISNKQGKWVNTIDYFIFNTEIVGCCSYCRMGLENYFAMDSNIDMPVPFKCGDIIEIDARPMHKKRRAIVVGTGDNRDCCDLQVLFINKDGELCGGALKHPDISIYKQDSWGNVLSPLYSAKIYDGELDANEVVFTKIQRFIHENLELWNDVESALPLHDTTLAEITDEYLQDLLQELKLLQKRGVARKQRMDVID